MASPPPLIPVDYLACVLGVFIGCSPISRVRGLMESIAGQGPDVRDPRTMTHIFSIFAGLLCGGSMLHYVLKVELPVPSPLWATVVKGSAYGVTGLVNLLLLGFLFFQCPRIRKVLKYTLLAAVTIGILCYSIVEMARTHFDTTVPLEIVCLVLTVAMGCLQLTSQDASQGSDRISATFSVAGLLSGLCSCVPSFNSFADHRTFKMAVGFGGLFNILDAIVFFGSKSEKVRHLL